MVLAAHDLLLIQCVATPIAAIALIVALFAWFWIVLFFILADAVFDAVLKLPCFSRNGEIQ
jgi:uncharacterized membrane protein YqiK